MFGDRKWFTREEVVCVGEFWGNFGSNSGVMEMSGIYC